MARGARRAPGPCVLLRRNAGESSRQVWYRSGRCCGFMSTSQSPITIYQSPSRASSSWPVGLVAPPAPAFSFVETPGSPPAEFGTGVADVAGLCRHRKLPITIFQSQSRASSSWPANWAWQILRGIWMQSSRARAAVYRPPSTVVVSSGRLADLCQPLAAPQLDDPSDRPSSTVGGEITITYHHLSITIKSLLASGQPYGLADTTRLIGCKARELAQPLAVHRWPSLSLPPARPFTARRSVRLSAKQSRPSEQKSELMVLIGYGRKYDAILHGCRFIFLPF